MNNAGKAVVEGGNPFRAQIFGHRTLLESGTLTSVPRKQGTRAGAHPEGGPTRCVRVSHGDEWGLRGQIPADPGTKS